MAHAAPQKKSQKESRPQLGTQEKMAIFVIIAIVVLILLALFFTFQRPEGPGHSPAESPIVKQRIINLQKSR